MNAPTPRITETAALGALIDRLTEPPRPAGGVIWEADSDAGEALDALVTIVDDTVLRRMLRFETDTGAVLKIEVANRRMRRIAAVPETQAKISKDTLVGRELDADQDLLALRALIDLFCADAQLIRFASLAPLGAAPPTHSGISAPVMRAAWGLETSGAAQPGFDRAIDAAQKLATTFVLRVNGAVTDQGGSGADGLPMAGALLASHTETDPTIVILRGADGTLLVARTGSTELVALLPDGAMFDVTDAWRP